LSCSNRELGRRGGRSPALPERIPEGAGRKAAIVATMMVSVVFALTLATANATPVEVQGESTCPTASEVAAILPELLPPTEASSPDIAWIEAAGLDLQIELRAHSGEVLFSRRLTSSGTCADLAIIAAVVIASWTAERNPGISLLQPGVLAPPQPKPFPPPPPAPAPPPSREVLAPAAQGRKPEFDFSAGLGSSVNSAGFVGAARAEVGMRGRRFGLRVGFAAETARSETIETRTVSWRRYDLSAGPTLALVRQPVMVDARAELFAGFTTVAGYGFDVDRRSSAVAPGLALALRMGASTGWIRPWVEIGGQYWLASQEIAITRELQPSSSVALPHAEGRLFAGISIVLPR
jgi:hypothetical protein